MEVHRRGNENQPWFSFSQHHIGEIAASLKLVTIEVPFDPHPIIESLQREMHILGGLELDDGQPTLAVGREQVDDASVGSRDRRDLAIKRLGQKVAVDQIEPMSDL